MNFNQEKKYYVYMYLRKDGTPYYVGKGCGNRAYKKSNNRREKRLIPKDVSQIIIKHNNLTESQAYSLEMDYIAGYGTKYDNTGILRNLTKGGENPPKTKTYKTVVYNGVVYNSVKEFKKKFNLSDHLYYKVFLKTGKLTGEGYKGFNQKHSEKSKIKLSLNNKANVKIQYEDKIFYNIKSLTQYLNINYRTFLNWYRGTNEYPEHLKGKIKILK